MSVDPSARVVRTRVLELYRADSDSYAFRSSLVDRSHNGQYESGLGSEIIHDFAIAGRIDRSNLRICELHIEAVTHPYPACPNIIGVAQKLVGISLNVGWRKAVLEHLGGTQGCTHVTTLLLGLSELTTQFFFLEVNGELPYGQSVRNSGKWMNACLKVSASLDGACHVLAEDGEVLTRARDQ
jgi:hypothetical protein